MCGGWRMLLFPHVCGVRASATPLPQERTSCRARETVGEGKGGIGSWEELFAPSPCCQSSPGVKVPAESRELLPPGEARDEMEAPNLSPLTWARLQRLLSPAQGCRRGLKPLWGHGR